MSDIKFNNRYFLAKVKKKGIKLVLISIHYTILILSIKKFFCSKIEESTLHESNSAPFDT